MYLVPKTIEDLNRQLSTSVGFDSFFNRLFDDAYNSGGSGTYPPYNIRKVNDCDYVIELALAGFTKDDLDLELTEGTLTVKSVPKTDESDESYLHHGIAKRVFTRKFNLADDVIITGAELFNGLLQIKLERVIPEEKRPRKIEIIDDGVKVVEHKVV
jgi:molecular chaperone IbpA